VGLLRSISTTTTSGPIFRDGSGPPPTVRISRWLGESNLLFSLCAFVIVASLILGGGTRGGFLSDAMLQLSAIPLLLAVIWRLGAIPLTKPARAATWFCLAVAAVPLVQLIPLPPWLWTALPNRQLSIEVFSTLHHEAGWMPISVSPRETWLSALSLIPPLGIFLCTLLFSYRERRLLSLVILAIGVVSVFIGLIQVAQGPNSPLRFFQLTNPDEAVGFFANRNHFAAFLYALTLFAAAWGLRAPITVGTSGHAGKYDTASVVAMIGGFTLLVILLAGEAMARSRAGLGFTIAALCGAFALGFSDPRGWAEVTPRKLLLLASALAGLFAVQFALYRIMERFALDPLEDARLPFARNTIKAALAYMPLGSGLGTFVSVYGTFEKPADTIANTYANHAHNDVLELWLNTGVVGLILLGVFVVWLAYRSVEIWRSAPMGASELDWSLMRVASLVVALLIAHSFLDYPLRTGAMMAILAFSCALLIEPSVGESSGGLESLSTAARPRERRQKKPAMALPSTGVSTDRVGGGQPTEGSEIASDQRWGANIEWPDAWSESLGRPPPLPKKK
jgi:O-antigen ligase